MKEKAVHNGYCLHCGKEGKKPFCNRQCYLGYVRQNPNRSRDYEKQQRNELTDRIVKRNIYIRSKGGIKYNQMTPKMIEETRARILAHRQKTKLKKERLSLPIPKKPKQQKQCECSMCGETFFVDHKSKYCSDECRKEKARRDSFRSSSAKKEMKARSCKECGDTFIPEYGDKRRRFCSDTCRHKNVRRCRKQKERARIKKARVETVNAVEIFMRDGWRCQLCGKKLNPKHRGTYRNDAPELDHIIPLSRGGDHSRKNTQCACRKCNAKKGDREYGQERMFG